MVLTFRCLKKSFFGYDYFILLRLRHTARITEEHVAWTGGSIWLAQSWNLLRVKNRVSWQRRFIFYNCSRCVLSWRLFVPSWARKRNRCWDYGHPTDRSHRSPHLSAAPERLRSSDLLSFCEACIPLANSGSAAPPACVCAAALLTPSISSNLCRSNTIKVWPFKNQRGNNSGVSGIFQHIKKAPARHLSAC